MITRIKVLVDSSFLYALFDHTDNYHTKAFNWSSGNPALMLVPQVALNEVMFLLNRNGGVPATVAFLNGFTVSPYELTSITVDDLKRVSQIRQQYAQARLDFVDCCIMALAERLNITSVCTFDRRDFAIFRPQHTPYLELLP